MDRMLILYLMLAALTPGKAGCLKTLCTEKPPSEELTYTSKVGTTEFYYGGQNNIMAYEDAKQYCAKYKMGLAEPDTVEKFESLIDEINKPLKKFYWVGGRSNNYDGKFRWECKGTVIKKSLWAHGEPVYEGVNECALIRLANKTAEGNPSFKKHALAGSFCLRKKLKTFFCQRDCEKDSTEMPTTELIPPEKSTVMSTTEFEPSEKSTEMPTTEVIPPEKSTEMSTTEFVPPEKSTEMPTTEVIPPEKSTEMSTTEFVPPEKSSEMPTTEVIPPEKSTEIPTTEVIPRENSTEMATTEYIPTSKITTTKRGCKPNPLCGCCCCIKYWPWSRWKCYPCSKRIHF